MIRHAEDTLLRKLRLSGVTQLARGTWLGSRVRCQGLCPTQYAPSLPKHAVQRGLTPAPLSGSSEEVTYMEGPCHLSSADERKGTRTLLIPAESTLASAVTDVNTGGTRHPRWTAAFLSVMEGGSPDFRSGGSEVEHEPWADRTLLPLPMRNSARSDAKLTLSKVSPSMYHIPPRLCPSCHVCFTVFSDYLDSFLQWGTKPLLSSPCLAPGHTGTVRSQSQTKS